MFTYTYVYYILSWRYVMSYVMSSTWLRLRGLLATSIT
jgi:hypothetical protein